MHLGRWWQSRPETAEHWLLLVLVLDDGRAGAESGQPGVQRFTIWAGTIAASAHLLVGRFGLEPPV